MLYDDVLGTAGLVLVMFIKIGHVSRNWAGGDDVQLCTVNSEGIVHVLRADSKGKGIEHVQHELPALLHALAGGEWAAAGPTEVQQRRRNKFHGEAIPEVPFLHGGLETDGYCAWLAQRLNHPGEDEDVVITVNCSPEAAQERLPREAGRAVLERWRATAAPSGAAPPAAAQPLLTDAQPPAEADPAAGGPAPHAPASGDVGQVDWLAALGDDREAAPHAPAGGDVGQGGRGHGKGAGAAGNRWRGAKGGQGDWQRGGGSWEGGWQRGGEGGWQRRG